MRLAWALFGLSRAAQAFFADFERPCDGGAVLQFLGDLKRNLRAAAPEDSIFNYAR